MTRSTAFEMILRVVLLFGVLGLGVTPPASAAERAPVASYIVVLVGDPPATPDAADRVRATANALVAAHGGAVERVYGTALNGFAARLTPAQAKAFAADARVRYVEPDAVMRTQPNK